MHPRHYVLRRLVAEYQETHSRSSFEGILKRVDDLIIFVVHGLQRKYLHLRKVGFEDLYQTAIIGVIEAVLTVKDESGQKIPVRIIAYIKAAIRRTFKYTEGISGGNVVGGYLSEGTLYEPDISRRIELVDLCMIGYQCLDTTERDLLYKRFFCSMTYIEIGKELSVSKQVARRRVLKVLEKLRFRLRLREGA